MKNKLIWIGHYFLIVVVFRIWGRSKNERMCHLSIWELWSQEVTDHVLKGTRLSDCLLDFTWKNEYLTTEWKLKIYEAMASPVMTYGSRTRTDTTRKKTDDSGCWNEGKLQWIERQTRKYSRNAIPQILRNLWKPEWKRGITTRVEMNKKK